MIEKLPSKNELIESKRAERLRQRLSAFAQHIEEHCKLEPHALLKCDEASPDLLNPSQVTDYLGISPKTLANLRTIGTGPEYCKIGSRIFYRHADVLQYRRARQFKNTSQYRSGPDNGGLEQ